MFLVCLLVRKIRKCNVEMSIQFVTLAYVLIPILQMQVIFTHLKLLVAVARHNFMW